MTGRRLPTVTLAMRPRRSFWWLTALLYACEVGQPLVDSRSSSEIVGPEDPCRWPECSVVDDGWPSSSSMNAKGPVVALDLSACGASAPEAGCEPDLGDAGAPPQLAEGGAPASCGNTLDLKALRRLDGESRECETLDIDIDAPSAKRVRLDGLSLRQVNLNVRSRMPLELQLRHAELSEVRVTLEGPVSLHVVEPVVFAGVRARGNTSERGAPALELQGVETRGLQVGDGSSTFEGTVAVLLSVVEGWYIAALDVHFESTVLSEGRVDAQTLMMLDTSLVQVVVGADEAQVAASRWSGVLYERCGTLALLGTGATHSYFGPCDSSPLRMYDSSMISGAVDGTVEAVDATFTKTRFGLEHSTELATWNTAVVNSNFCGRAKRHAASGGYLRCSICEGGLAKRRSACLIDEVPVIVNRTACAAWNEAAGCEHPPSRQRPDTSLAQ